MEKLMGYYRLNILLLMLVIDFLQNGIASNLISLTFKGLVNDLKVQHQISSLQL